MERADRTAAGAKAALRASVLARRAARTPEQRELVAALLARRGLELCAGATAVAAYASYGGEPGTGELRRALAAAGVTVLLPVVRAAELAWVVDDGGEPQRGGERGMPEPTGAAVGVGADALLAEGVRVLLLPALAVAEDGVRLGKGGGYYDRLLADLPPHPLGPLRVGVVHDDELLPAGAVPAEPHDLAARVDVTLSPDGRSH